MSDRYDLVAYKPPAKEGEKSYPVRIGVMFARDKGGYCIVMETIPMWPWGGKCLAFPAKPREEYRPAATPTPAAPAPEEYVGDDVPF